MKFYLNESLSTEFNSEINPLDLKSFQDIILREWDLNYGKWQVLIREHESYHKVRVAVEIGDVYTNGSWDAKIINFPLLGKKGNTIQPVRINSKDLYDMLCHYGLNRFYIEPDAFGGITKTFGTN